MQERRKPKLARIYAWERACEAAGLPLGRKGGGYVIHDLRHTFVSEAHDAGLSAGVTMAFTGHVQEPTMHRYLRVSATAQAQAQQVLEAHRRAQAQRVAEQRKKVVELAGRRAAS
jgi:integrase